MGKPINNGDANEFKSIEGKGSNAYFKEQQEKKEKVKVLVSTPEGKNALLDYIFSGKDSNVENPLETKKTNKKEVVKEVEEVEEVEEILDDEDLQLLDEDLQAEREYQESLDDTLSQINGDVDENN